MFTWRSWLFVFIIGSATTLYWQDQYFDTHIAEEVEKLRLLNIYNLIKKNPTVLHQLEYMDVSGFKHQFRMYNIQSEYGFSKEISELLYKYHRYHGAQVGDYIIILEDIEQFKQKQELNELNKPLLQLAAYETARYNGWRYCIYLLFIYILTGPPSPESN